MPNLQRKPIKMCSKRVDIYYQNTENKGGSVVEVILKSICWKKKSLKKLKKLHFSDVIQSIKNVFVKFESTFV